MTPGLFLDLDPLTIPQRPEVMTLPKIARLILQRCIRYFVRVRVWPSL